MESAGNASGMQPWRDYFPFLSLEPHAGQRQLFEIAAAEGVAERLAVMPTGYGKTYAAAGYYAIRRSRSLINRCLWIVSSDAQRDGLFPDPKKVPRRPNIAKKLTTWFGLPCLNAYLADGSPASLRMHWEDRAEIFITSYTHILYNAAYYQELLDPANGRWTWLIHGDEAHHLSEDGAWGARLAPLPRVETLYSSATPIRTDKRPLRGVPSKPNSKGETTYDACVDIPWQQAMDEGAIRKPRAHAQEWELEVADKQGEVIKLTTTDLAAIGSDLDLDQYLLKRDLRFTTTYVHKLFTDALSRLTDKRAQWPGTHQMIVFALSCGHAEFLATEVFSGVIDADWIGVTRNEAENKAILDRYLDGTLSVLVQVNKAAEGFDNPPSSIELFLNLIRSPTTLMQQLGRGARRLFDIPAEHDWLDVFADTSHPVIGIVRELEPRDDAYGKGGDGGPGGDGGDWEPLPAIREIEARWLSTQIVTPSGMPQFADGVLSAAQRFGMAPEDVEAIMHMVNGTTPTTAADGPAPDEASQRAFYEDRVKRAMAAVTSHALALLRRRQVVDNPKYLAGLIKKNLNIGWKIEHRRGHNAMLSEDFKAKYNWLHEIDHSMKKSSEVPLWLYME